MRFLLVNRFFGGQQTPSGRMLLDVACELARRGHSVEVLTSRQAYEGTVSESQSDSGIRIRSIATGSSRRKLVQWLFFWLQACVRAPLMRWDRCIVLTDPPFMNWIAFLTGARRRRAVFWWTMDLYPQALVAGARVARGGLADRFFSVLSDFSLARLRGVICLGSRQRELLARYKRWSSDAAYSIVIPPWDDRPPGEAPRTNRFRQRYELEGKHIALYAGNLGEAHCFEPFLEAAAHLQRLGIERWHLVFVVRGSRRPALENAARTLRNVSVIDYQPADWTGDMLWAADVHLISMRAGWDGIVVPSKLYGALRVGTPVLFVGPEKSDTAAEIARLDVGAILPAGAKGAEVAEALERCLIRKRRSITAVTDGPAKFADFVCSTETVGPHPTADESAFSSAKAARSTEK